jgi:hypothetical protein
LLGELPVLAGARGGACGELGVTGGVPADAGQGEVADDEGGVLVVAGEAVVVSPVGAGDAVVVAAVGADGLVRGGVAAALGGEVSAEAE